jgi:hypothetical protein
MSRSRLDERVESDAEFRDETAAAGSRMVEVGTD